MTECQTLFIPSSCSDTDVHTVGSLLKLYLRELPEPVVPWTQYQDFLDSTLMLDATTATVRITFTKTVWQMSKDSLINCNLINSRAKKSWRNKSVFYQK